jgi:hypothetical protein
VGVGDDPVAAGLDEFKAYGKTGLGSGLAIGDARDGAKRAGEGGDRQAIICVPAARAEDASAVRADVFGECGFRPGQSGMTGDVHAYFHRNTRLATRSDGSFWDPHPKSNLQSFPFLQAGRYMPQAKFFLALALHAIQSAIGGAQELFDRGAIVRIDGDANADGDGRLLAIIF